MSFQFRKPTTKRDFVEATTQIVFLAIKGVAAASSGTYLAAAPSTYGHLNKFIKSIEAKEETAPENLAWTWLALTIAEATTQFAIRLQRFTILNANTKEDAIADFIESCLDLPSSATFDDLIFSAPHGHQAFAPARKALPKLIHEVTLLTKYDFVRWDREFNECLKYASQYITAARHQLFEPIITSITGILNESTRQEAAWARHNQWLHHRFTETPVFSPDGSVETPLCDLYLKLRCYWHVKESGARDSNNEIETKWYAHIGHLHDEIDKWLTTADKDNIRVVAGGPGSGKSSFARALASQTAYDGSRRVVFIEMQRLHMTGNLWEDITTYLETRDNPGSQSGSAGFPENPLQWLKSDPLPALLIFDGLDELTHDAELAKEKSSDFILQCKRLVTGLNEDGFKVKAIILGRNVSCQDGLKAASLPLLTMLNVAPIRPIEPADLRPSTDVRKEEPRNLVLPEIDGEFSEDQRPIYWNKWAMSLGTPDAKMPDAVNHEALSALNVEPLLLHLLILSDFCGERWPEAADNRNLVYEDILVKIQKRNEAKNHTLRGLGLADFMLLMECLGLAAWRGNGRAGDEAAFDSVRQSHARHRQNALKEIGADKLENIIVHAHARRVDGDKPGFEFIHKSFGEYLAARGLVSMALKTSSRMSNLDDPIDEKTAARTWIEIVDDGALTREVSRFVTDEARRRFDEKEYEIVKTKLETILKWENEFGFPIGGEVAGTFRELEVKQRCSEVVLVALGTAIVGSLNSKKSSTSSKHYFLQDLPQVPMFRFGHRFLNYLSELSVGSLMHDMYLSFMPFQNNNFSFEADYSNSFMQGLMLPGATMYRTRLISADLRESYLDGAFLQMSDLSGADLRGVHMDKMSAMDANFDKAIFGRTRARGADFTNAWNLTDEQLEGILGVKSGIGRTILPEGLTAPDFWLEEPDENLNSGILEDTFNKQYKVWCSSQPSISN